MAFIECDLKRTENADRLIRDLKKFFPDADFKESGSSIKGESSLSRFKEICDEQKTSVCSELLDSGESRLDKMAMHAGIIAPCDEAPLGCVRITAKKA